MIIFTESLENNLSKIEDLTKWSEIVTVNSRRGYIIAYDNHFKKDDLLNFLKAAHINDITHNFHVLHNINSAVSLFIIKETFTRLTQVKTDMFRKHCTH